MNRSANFEPKLAKDTSLQVRWLNCCVGGRAESKRYKVWIFENLPIYERWE